VRIAIVSDIHGNLTAFEAVLADLGETAPDLILHGGDLGDNGSRPVEVIDRIRDFGWRGVLGNTDQMLFAPETLTAYGSKAPAEFQPMFAALEEMAAASRDLMGADRLAWLRELPMTVTEGEVALVHASPASCWSSPADSASDEELRATYAPLGGAVAVYGHTHMPYVREIAGLTVANSGSVGLPFDGDRRAGYLLIDGVAPVVRRVEYDVDRELKALREGGRPHAEWIARTLKTGCPQRLFSAPKHPS
jgi:putative phosphoesterase